MNYTSPETNAKLMEAAAAAPPMSPEQTIWGAVAFLLALALVWLMVAE